MLRAAHAQGILDAFNHFRVKEAGKGLSFLRQMAVGEIPAIGKAIAQKKPRSLFKAPIPGVGGKPGTPGGPLNVKQIFWPKFDSKPQTWLYRGMGALPAWGAVQAARGKAGDPSESRLSNVLGSLGSGVGLMYGGIGLGMLGAPLLASAGHRIGKGIGRTFSKRPEPQPPTTPQYPQRESASPYDNYPGVEQRLPVSPYSRGS